MNSNYRAGRALEYRVIRELEAQGYVCVRSAGSKGPWDVTAVHEERNEKVRLVQVKCGSWPSPVERERLIFLMGSHVQCEAWRYDKGDTKPKIRIVDGTW